MASPILLKSLSEPVAWSKEVRTTDRTESLQDEDAIEPVVLGLEPIDALRIHQLVCGVQGYWVSSAEHSAQSHSRHNDSAPVR